MDKQVVFNDGGAAAGDAGLTFTKGTGTLAATVFSGPLTGNVTGNVTGSSGSTTGNAATASSAAKWTTARNLAGNSVDGSANVAFANKFVVQGTADAGLSGPQFLGALGTGIVKNTVTTGVLSVAVAGDFPTLNQSTSGTAAGLSATLVVGSGGTGTATQLTPGSVVFVTAGGVYTQDNANLFWDSTNKRLGLGLSVPVATLNVENGSIAVGSGSNTTQTNVLLQGYGYRLGSQLFGPASIQSAYENAGNTSNLLFYVGSSGTTTTLALTISANGRVGIGTLAPTSPLQVVTLPTFATNALAIAGGLTAGAFFKVNVAGEYQVHVVV